MNLRQTYRYHCIACVFFQQGALEPMQETVPEVVVEATPEAAIDLEPEAV